MHPTVSVGEQIVQQHQRGLWLKRKRFRFDPVLVGRRKRVRLAVELQRPRLELSFQMRRSKAGWGWAYSRMAEQYRWWDTPGSLSSLLSRR